MKGFDQFKRDVKQFSERVQEEAVDVGVWAAARASKEIIEAAAQGVHKVSGSLGNSVKIIAYKNRGLTGSKFSDKLQIGPERKSGFQGFFVDRGWKHPTGPRKNVQTRRGRSFVTGRRARTASGNTHSQSGVSGSKKIEGTHWFTKVIPQVETAAEKAGNEAITRRIKRLAKQGEL